MNFGFKMRMLGTFCVLPERVDAEEAKADYEEETTWRGGWSLQQEDGGRDASLEPLLIPGGESGRV